MTDDTPDFDPIPNTPQQQPHCWLQLPAAAVYCGVRPVTLLGRIAKGVGPPFHRFPNSRIRIFRTDRLDQWLETTPERQLTPEERARTKKLQAGNLRAFERRRAKQAKEMAMASLASRRANEASPDELEIRGRSERARARRAAKASEDVTA